MKVDSHLARQRVTVCTGQTERYRSVSKRKIKKYLIFRREISEKPEIQGYIAYGDDRTKIEEFVRAAGTRWTIETNFAEMKGETGLDQYEVRGYDSWYKHITLSCVAHAFLTILREQIWELPYLSATYENTMGEFKKEKIKVVISKTEIRRIIADFIYATAPDFSFQSPWRVQPFVRTPSCCCIFYESAFTKHLTDKEQVVQCDKTFL